MNRQLIDPTDFFDSPEAVEAELKPDSPAICLACNRYGSLLAVGCENGDVVIYDMMTRGLAARLPIDPRLEGPGKSVASVAWSSNGHQLIAGSAAGVVTLWNIVTAAVVAAHRYAAPVTAVSMASRDGVAKVLVTFAAGHPHVWDVQSGASVEVMLPALHSSKGRVFGAMDRGGRHIVLVSDHGIAAIYSVNGLALLDVLKVPGTVARGGTSGTPVRGMSLSAKGNSALVLTSTSIRSISIKPVTSQIGSFSALEAIERVAQLAGGETLRREGPLLEASEPEYKNTTTDNVRWRCCDGSRDGEYVLAGADAKDRHLIYVWDHVTGRLLRVLEGPQLGMLACIWHPSPYRQLILSVTKGGRIFIWSHLIKENWEVFAPGFRSLDRNIEYVESETEFDLNPDPSKANDSGKNEDGEIDVMTKHIEDQKIFDDDTEDDIKNYLRTLPLNLNTPQAAPIKQDAPPAASAQEPPAKRVCA